MGDNLIDNGQKTSPGIDTLDPGEIAGDSLAITIDVHGFQAIRTIVAPGVALDDDALYTLVFKVATPWKNLPGSSNSNPSDPNDADAWITMNFAPAAGISDVQITHILKAGSTPGNWIAFA